MPKFCGNCGFKFDRDYKFCPECGTKVGGTITAKQKYAKGEKHSSVAEGEKTLNPKFLLIFALAGVALILLILFSAGVFDSTEVVNQVPNQNQEQGQFNNPSGVNLNNIQRINELEAKVNANPDNLQLLLDLAHLQNDSGLYEKAIVNYKKYLEANPSDADARVDMGVCYFNLGNYETAAAEMKKALEYEPGHQIAHLNLGVVNINAGNIEEAKEWWQKAVEINPANEIGQKAQNLLNSH